MKQCLKIIVSGKVQGVGYREFVRTEADRLEIEGTIQNSADGSVVIYACGNSEKLDSLIDVLYDGPPKVQVTNVAAEPLVAPKDFRGVFRIIG